MQTAYPPPFICNVTSPEQYVAGGMPPTVMTSFPGAVDYGISPAILPDVTHAGGAMPVFLKVGENLVIPQGNPHLLPQFAPGIQTLQYVAVPPTMAPLPTFVTPPTAVKPHTDPACSMEQQHLQGRHLAMSEVNQMLPPVEARQILVPRRRSGQRNAPAPPRFPHQQSNAERTLRGNSVATRRTSQSFDDDSQNLSTPSPMKKSAPFCRDVQPVTSPTGEGAAPDARTLQKVCDVLEYYFSDDCLSKNAYLLKQISQQENGFVSLRRIAALKRIKSLTRDIRTVAHCARQSRKLEISEDGTMIRRVQPLPNNMEPPRFIRTVIAINLPLESPTIESVTSLFASFGDLTQVRVLKPGKPLPSYLRDYTAWVPDLGQNSCAMVEFESQDEAQRACREINMNHRKFKSLRVALLKPGARLRRTLYRKYKYDEGAKTDENCASPRNSTNCCGEVPLEEMTQIAITKATDQSRDYDASGSGSDSDAAEADPVRFVAKRAVSDSGFSQSSGDEQEKTMRLHRNARRPARPSPAQKGDSSDGSDVTNAVTSRQRKSARGLVSAGVLRNPVGPADNTTKGFKPGFRKCLT